jgi:tRNA threonylcarbamoyladenosine modification (KEOPS) complex  Pcc1 subunit
VALEGSGEKRWAYGSAPSVIIQLLAVHTILLQRRFNATIEIRAKDSANAIYSALKPDVKSSPERQVSANIRLSNDEISIDISSNDLSHLRAGLNSYLRLAKTASSCLDATAL